MASTAAGPSSRAARPPPEPIAGGPPPSSLRTRAATMATTAAGGDAARGGLNAPHPNPSGDGGPKLRSPPGKANKPVALVDITNTGRPNATRSISVPDLVKENAKLMTLLNEKIKIIEANRIEIYKLRLALQAWKQQNLHIAQNNSQMLAEINAGKDRIKILQHEISCASALLKVKDSELERNKNAAKGQRKGVKSEVLMKGTASIVTGVDAVTSGIEHHLVESQSTVSTNTLCQELPQDGAQKRMPQRRKSSRLNQGSCGIGGVSQNTLHEATVAPVAPSTLRAQKHATVHEVVMASGFNETEINEQLQKTTLKEIQEACSRKSGDNDPHKIGDNAFNSKQSHLTAAISSIPLCQEPPLDTKQKRIPPRRRSSRLNQGFSEIGGVSQNTLPEDTVADLGPSALSVQNHYGQTTGQHMEESLQNECIATLHEETETNLQPRKKEIQESCSRDAEVKSHKIGDKASTASTSLSVDTVDPSEPPENNAMKRCASHNSPKLAVESESLSRWSKKRSAIEDVNAKLDMTTREPLHKEEKRKSQRRKSTRLNSVSSEDTDITVETEHRDVIAPLAGSSSDASRTNQEQNDDRSSRKSNEGQISGRRSLRRAAEKVVSYKEIPLNVKMRRP